MRVGSLSPNASAIFLNSGKAVMSGETEAVRRESGKTLDELFREVFRCF